MKRFRRAAQVTAGVVVGLFAVEVMCSVRDHGAFPHLNCYRSDDQLGVRLLPGATEKISFSHNPVSSVRINAEGYRGAEWPAHADGEIFVVGDSQAFGLGVNEDDAFAWQVAKKLHRPLANGAVPTYGPAEYNAVLAEQLPKRKPKTVLYVINIANDLFEAVHPNTTRHAVWDGWAVRKETAPASVTSFPGRDLLFRRSHAFFAVRGLWFRTQGDAETATPSEGGWADLLTASSSLTSEKSAQQAAAAAERKKRDEALAAAIAEQRQLDTRLGDKIYKALPDEEVGVGTLHAAHASPGDIVRPIVAEGARPVRAVATEIQRAAAVRRRFEDKLREAHDDAGLADLKAHDAVDDKIANLRATPIDAIARAHSPLRPHLEAAKKLCDQNGAELVVVVLPLDVMVSPEEWKKYPGASVDLSGTRILADDVLTMSEELGARAFDAWPALAKAEPGAFLDGDLHMSPKGHAAVGAALAEAIAHPPPPRAKLPALPVGRSPVPRPNEWTSADALKDQVGLDRADLKRFDCRLQRVREWVRLACKGGALQLNDAGKSEPLLINTPDGSSLVAALLEGSRFRATWFGKRTGVFIAEWPLGETTPSLSFVDAPAKTSTLKPRADELMLCDCYKQVYTAQDCGELYGSPQAGCMKAYAGDCRSLLACSRGDATAPPQCESGYRIRNVTHRCEILGSTLEDLLLDP